MKNDLYLLTTLSNLHVGSGDINFDIIDRQVQKDAITEIPVIHSSSIKGAYREAAGEGSQYTQYIFGPANDENDTHRTGAFHFFEAMLLSRPVRSNVKPYYNATSPAVLKAFLSLLEDFDITIEAEAKEAIEALAALEPRRGAPMVFDNENSAVLEEFEAVSTTLQTAPAHALLGENVALFEDADFKKLDLPVLARNQLENGESKNLWYEEVVPKQSRFVYVIAKPDNVDEADNKEKIEAFEARFDNTTTVQFGANKSIGYGYSKVQKVSL